MQPPHRNTDQPQQRRANIRIAASSIGTKFNVAEFVLCFNLIMGHDFAPTCPRMSPLASLMANPGGHGNSSFAPATLQRFDYVRDVEQAMRWRDAGVPFVLTGVQELADTTSLWTGSFIRRAGGETMFATEMADGQEHTYWEPTARRPKGAAGLKAIAPNALVP